MTYRHIICRFKFHQFSTYVCILTRIYTRKKFNYVNTFEQRNYNMHVIGNDNQQNKHN